MEVTDSRKNVAVKLGFVKRVEPESNTVLMQGTCRRRCGLM